MRESERERNTLQELLQQIIQDKIELKQKIESFEIDMESTWSMNQSLYAKFDSNASRNSSCECSNQPCRCSSNHRANSYDSFQDNTTNSCESTSNLDITTDITTDSFEGGC